VRYRIAILGHLPDSEALLIENEGANVHFVQSDSYMEWRDSPQESSLSPVRSLLTKLARTQGLPSSSALMRHVDQVAVAISGLDCRFPSTRFMSAMDTAGVRPDLVTPLTLAEATHLGCFIGGPGVLVRSGHGSSAFGKAKSKTTALAGGWGATVGDHGSGAWIGQQALTRVSRLIDGGATESDHAIVTRLLEHLTGSDSSRTTYPFERMEPLRAVGGQAAVRIFLTEVAREVLELSCDGDAVAEEIVNQACTHLGNLVEDVVRRVEPDQDNLPIRLSGSLLNAFPQFRSRLIRYLRDRLGSLGTADIAPNRQYTALIGVGLRSLNCFEPDEVASIGSRFMGAIVDKEWARPVVEREEINQEKTPG
jgi:N-acetylglucosamine kinase-like BadF-type ATPase